MSPSKLRACAQPYHPGSGHSRPQIPSFLGHVVLKRGALEGHRRITKARYSIFLFSWLEIFGRKFGFHVFKPVLNLSFRLSRLFFVKRIWIRQMVNAIAERNQNSPVLNSVHHLPKPWSDRFTHVNSRKTLCPNAWDTASSHRYLPLGTFRQRAVRGECIPHMRHIS